MKKLFFVALVFALGVTAPSCSPADEVDKTDTSGLDPDFDGDINDYDGDTADDADDDNVGDNIGTGAEKDFYWESADNSWKKIVTVTYNGSTAEVTTTNDKVIWSVDGAYVTIDMETNDADKCEIIVSGTSPDGGLKLYGVNKYKLTLAGVSLTSKKGPAINNQCKKRVFVHLNDGTTNSLTDCTTYAADPYYLTGTALDHTADNEDRKGAFFSEAHLIMSGTGVLEVEGKYKHALVTDGYFYMRPGVTIAVKGAAGNGIHVKGDETDGIGIQINGGLIYANVASVAGKCIKTDYNFEMSGGRLELNTTGNAYYDTTEKDTSSAAAIKTNGDIIITGGEIVVKSSGSGGKGLSADADMRIDGGVISVTTTGSLYKYNTANTSSPKGIRADGDIVINGGDITIKVTGTNDGAEGIESKKTITINDGTLYSYAYDDAMNAGTHIQINGGNIFCYAEHNDGIDSNGTMTIAGGLVISSGTSAPEEGFDCDQNTFKITGGILIGTGGATSTPTANFCTQRSVIYNGISVSKGDKICIRNTSTSAPILLYEMPRGLTSMCLLFSSPDLKAGTQFTLLKGGTVSGAATPWNGYYASGTWASGSSVGNFTTTNMVTTVGSSGGPGGGGGPGGR